MRGDHERPGVALRPRRRPQATGAFRIVCVGDSVTFGYRVPRVYLRRPRENPGVGCPIRCSSNAGCARRIRGGPIEVIPARHARVLQPSGPGLAAARHRPARPGCRDRLLRMERHRLRGRSDAQCHEDGGWPASTARRLVSQQPGLDARSPGGCGPGGRGTARARRVRRVSPRAIRRRTSWRWPGWPARTMRRPSSSAPSIATAWPIPPKATSSPRTARPCAGRRRGRASPTSRSGATEAAHPGTRASSRSTSTQPPRPQAAGDAAAGLPGATIACSTAWPPLTVEPAVPRRDRRGAAGVKRRGALLEAALAALFGLGALHWLYVFGFLTPGFAGMSFTVADWPKEVRYYVALQQALVDGRIPWYVSKSIQETRKFLANPEVPWSPDVLLLRFVGIEVFLVLKVLLWYAVGFRGPPPHPPALRALASALHPPVPALRHERPHRRPPGHRPLHVDGLLPAALRLALPDASSTARTRPRRRSSRSFSS